METPNLMTRYEAFERALEVTAQRGAVNGELAVGPALAKICRAALSDDNLNACITNSEPTDPRKMLLSVMKDMRDAMKELRAEMDAIDSIGM